ASVDLGSLIKEVLEGLEAQAADAGVTVDFDRPSEPARATGDRDELYEVFENLIDNAIKYGRDGVNIHLGPAQRSGFEWQVTVVDNGAGIEAEHVPRLTERFYRV